jgi:hypothetical protein
MAAATGPDRATVGRIWRAFGFQPDRTETFKLSTDPQLIEKVRDIVGLYLNPPERGLLASNLFCPCRPDSRTTHAPTTTNAMDPTPSCGSRPRTRFSPASYASLCELLGYDTSTCFKRSR